MSRTFKIPVKQQPELLVSKAQEMALKNAVHFVADAVEGHFSGKGLEGNYRFEQDTLIVTVTKKPPFVTWAMVERLLHRFFV
jgi:hypothetical protein